MDPSKLKVAIAEAERFLDRARKAGTEDVEVYEPVDPRDTSLDKPWHHVTRKGTTPRTRAAIRRASLDLSHALADLRRR